MHGLINRAVQCYLRDTFGAGRWRDIARESRIGVENFEPMLLYPPGTTEALITAASRVMGRPRDALLEDMGTYLVSNPQLEALRRLLRFGGSDFEEFLHSLEDLPGRGRLALPDLALPDLVLTAREAGRYRLRCRSDLPGTGYVMIGLLRAMADDYGALALLDYLGAAGDCEDIGIELLETGFAEGRAFDLAFRTG
ncbi:heme NO-binding domain-containing protein [Szabonella alba]|uniref:Heme NO-binding domain-containing protein n=1 Tax=Szabonella alba TaxID=2804194 RepID=A0A8K0V651_9RHOB|nr:heme NO-binding domain-containing protein [Szabonella alba]MBL4915881.1 heme NO-binding domain-containing protein [Szabonella alba]